MRGGKGGVGCGGGSYGGGGTRSLRVLINLGDELRREPLSLKLGFTIFFLIFLIFTFFLLIFYIFINFILWLTSS